MMEGKRVQRQDPIGVAGGCGSGVIGVRRQRDARIAEVIVQYPERRERQDDVAKGPGMENKNLHYSMTRASRFFTLAMLT